MAKYGQPRALNAVSITMLIMLVIGGYAGYVFFPVYWDAWTVDHQLLEGASKVYSLSFLAEPARTKDMQAMLKKVQADAMRLGNITDPNFDVTLEIDGDNVVLRGEYDVTVTHPIGNYKTTLHMKRAEKANIKRVTWE